MTGSSIPRRAFLLGAGSVAAVACVAPERDLLEPYEDGVLPLEPGTAPPTTGVPAEGDPTTTLAEDLPPMERLRASVPAEDRPGLSFVARVKPDVSEVVVEASPGDGVAAFTFANPIASGGDLVFLVEDYDGIGHYRVLLPTRPNGSTGWFAVDDVALLRHNSAILVELDAFRLTVSDHDDTVLEVPVGVARDNAPTPRGRYYTTELLQPPEPDSVYGAYANGLSGFSEVFTQFRGGPGQLGIHGTNDPGSIGTNVSAGCIRMRNDDIAAIVEDLKVPTGVPVEVI